MTTSTGYGPRSGRPYFNGMNKDTSCGRRNFWVTCDCKSFTTPSCPPAEGGLAQDKLRDDKNAEAYAELCLSLNDCSLSLIIRDAKNDECKALEIL